MEASIETSTASTPAISFADDVSDLQIQAAQEFAVITDDNYEKAVTYSLGVASLKKKICDFFKPMEEAAFRSHKGIVAKKKAEIEPLEAIEKEIDPRLAAYKKRKDDERRALEAELEAEQRRIEDEARLAEATALEKEGQSELAAAVISAPSQLPPVRLAAPRPVPGFTTRENWDFVVEDLAKVPREYLMLDDKKVRGVVKAMKSATNIPGIRAYDKQSTVKSVR